MLRALYSLVGLWVLCGISVRAGAVSPSLGPPSPPSPPLGPTSWEVCCPRFEHNFALAGPFPAGAINGTILPFMTMQDRPVCLLSATLDVALGCDAPGAVARFTLMDATNTTVLWQFYAGLPFVKTRDDFGLRIEPLGSPGDRLFGTFVFFHVPPDCPVYVSTERTFVSLRWHSEPSILLASQ